MSMEHFNELRADQEAWSTFMNVLLKAYMRWSDCEDTSIRHMDWSDLEDELDLDKMGMVATGNMARMALHSEDLYLRTRCYSLLEQAFEKSARSYLLETQSAL